MASHQFVARGLQTVGPQFELLARCPAQLSSAGAELSLRIRCVKRVADDRGDG